MNGKVMSTILPGVFASLFGPGQYGGIPIMSMTHGQCDARPTGTFLVAERHRPLVSTKLYCLVTEAHVYIAGRKRGGRQSNLRPVEFFCKFSAVASTPRNNPMVHAS